MASKINILFGYSISIIVIIVVGVYSYRTLQYLESSFLQVNHSHKVLEQLSAFSSDLKDVQRGVRGFVLSGNSEYLVPYQESMQTISRNLDSLSMLTFDNPFHQPRIDSIQRTTAYFMTYYTDLIESRSDNGLDSVIHIVRQGTGKKLTDEILGIVNRMVVEEQHLLSIREIDDRAAREKMRLVLIIGNGIALFFILVSSTLMIMENSRRMKAETLLNRQTAELLAAKEKAESADKFKTIFLATMSHELRTPLSSIIGFSDIIQQGRSGPVNPEQYSQLGKVLSNARHLFRLINDTLDIAKIESGKLNIRHSPFHAGESIQKCLSMITPLADEKSLKVNVTIATSVGNMNGDFLRFEQILINILNNAIKFTSSGSVTLNASVIWSGSKELLKIQVTDTGIGIQEHDLQKLFQPFQQVNTGAIHTSEGTGLGLSISKKLSILLGGDISVSSTFGEGSTFMILLPTGNE